MTTKSIAQVMIEDDLIRHEGYVEEIYLCSAGYPTFGIGHKVTPQDPEYNLEVGSPVSKERCEQAFVQDLAIALEDAEKLLPGLTERPTNVQRVLVNMAFNLGYNRLSKFKRMLNAVNLKDYPRAAEEMIDSKWYHQVGRRGKELVRLMEWCHEDDL